MRRILAVLISLFCLLPAMPVVQGKAEAKVEFLQNGDFETIASSIPAGWSFSGTFGSECTIDAKKAFSGQNALALQADGAPVYAYQSIDGLCGGETYTLSAAIRAQSYESRTLQIKFEFYSLSMYGKKTNVGEIILEPAPKKDDMWETFTYEVAAPENAFCANILFRLPSRNGAIFYDALSLVGPQTEDAVPEIMEEALPKSTILPMAPSGEELIKNGSMNTIKDGGPEGWKFSTYAGSAAHAVTEPARSGTAIRLYTATENDAYAYYSVAGLRANATYQVSVYMRAHSLSGYGFGIKYEFTGADGYYSEAHSPRTRCITGTNWLQYAVTFRAPSGATGVRLLFRLYGTGTVYIDDASCYMTEEAYTFDMKTDEMFYYADATEARVSLAINPDKAAALSGEAFTCTLTGADILQTVQGTVQADGTAFASLSLADLTKEVGYTISATLAGVTRNETIYIFDRPQALGRDGIYRLEDNTPFDPVFAYHIATDDYPKAKAAGINLVQGFASEKVLSAAEDAGVMVLATLYDDMLPAGHPANLENTKQKVAALQGYKSVYAWCIMDEPYANNPGCAPYLAEAYRAIRLIDKVHPIFVMQDGAEFEDAARYTDILGIDPYPAGKEEPLTIVYERTAAAAAEGKPVYCLQQAFSYGGYFPTADEIINMNAQAVLAGAKAVGYYSWDASKNGKPLYETEIWDSIRSWNETDAPLLFDGIVRTGAACVTAGAVRYCPFTSGEKEYFLLQNSTASAQTVQVPLSGGAALLRPGRDDALIRVEGNLATVTIPASAAMLCEAVCTGDAIYLCVSDGIVQQPQAGDEIRAVFPEGAGVGYLAAYKGKELLEMVPAGERMTVRPGMDSIKAFYWCALQPACKKEEWRVQEADANIF